MSLCLPSILLFLVIMQVVILEKLALLILLSLFQGCVPEAIAANHSQDPGA